MRILIPISGNPAEGVKIEDTMNKLHVFSCVQLPLNYIIIIQQDRKVDLVVVLGYFSSAGSQSRKPDASR